MNKIAIAIVNYNTREHLAACLQTVRAHTSCEVVVVDNASSDGSVEMIKADFPWVKLYANHENVGYGAAANEAVARCSTPYVLLLNSDTLLEPGALQALVTYLDQHPKAAIVGPRIINPDRSLQRSCFPDPTPLNAFLRESSIGLLVGSVPGLRSWYLPTWLHHHPRIVPWVLGAAFGLRREAFAAVGGFDESFFMYYEETDLCFRLRAAGWQVQFAPVATIVHVGGASTVKYRAKMAVQLYASMFHFYRRHYSDVRMSRLRIVLSYVMLRNMIRDGVRLIRSRKQQRDDGLIEDVFIWHRILRHVWQRESVYG